MMDFVKESLIDADLLLYIISIEEKKIKDEGVNIADQKSNTPLLVLINKIDLSSQLELEDAVNQCSSFSPCKSPSNLCIERILC